MPEPEDFVTLMEREYEPLVRVATAIVGDEGSGREVVQEAFTRALVHWRRVSQYDRPGAWVRLVTVRLAVRAASRRRREGIGRVMPDAGRVDHYVDERLGQALVSLGQTDRAVVVLHYLCDLSVAEVARTLRRRPGTVRVQLHRARMKLAIALTEEEVDDAPIG